MGLSPLLPGSRPGQFMARQVHSWKGPDSPDKMCPRPYYSEAPPSLYVHPCTPAPLPHPHHTHTHKCNFLSIKSSSCWMHQLGKKALNQCIRAWRLPGIWSEVTTSLPLPSVNFGKLNHQDFNYNPIRDRQASTLAHRLVGKESLELPSPNAAVFSLSNSHS